MATVMTVNDDAAMLSIYREMLVTMNHRIVAEAGDDKEAIAIFRNLAPFPDIVLMDYRMPRKNEIDAIQGIRRINSEQFIIFITPDPDIAKEVKALGANTFVVKPFRLDKLSAIMNTVLEHHGSSENTMPF